MSKAKQKRAKYKEQAIKELVVLLPAYTYMQTQLAKQDEAEKKAYDYILAKRITSSMLTKIIIFKDVHQKAINKFNKLEEKFRENKINVFLLGLSLLAKHMEVKNKAINIGLSSEIVELQELCYEFFEPKEINRIADYTDKLWHELEF